MAIRLKVGAVLGSCQTKQQVAVAKRYIELARKAENFRGRLDTDRDFIRGYHQGLTGRNIHGHTIK